MFVGRVIDNQIEQDADAPAPSLGNQQIEIGKRSEFRRDIAIVRNVVTVVIHRRFEDRGEPYDVDAERRDIIQFRDNARNIADAVTVQIAEAARIDLVDGRAMPPLPFEGWRRFLDKCCQLILELIP